MNSSNAYLVQTSQWRTQEGGWYGIATEQVMTSRLYRLHMLLDFDYGKSLVSQHVLLFVIITHL